MTTRGAFTVAIWALAAALAAAQNSTVNPQQQVRDAAVATTALNQQRVLNLVQLTTDFDVLAFALNQEYLAASFWRCVAFGSPLPGSLTGGGPQPTGCKKAPLSGLSQAIAEEVAFDETAHVSFLRSQLGGIAPDIPPIDLTAGPKFIKEATGIDADPGADENAFWVNAFLLSDFEPTAYRGAVPLLRQKPFISGGVGIQGTEGYHAGILRKVLYDRKDQTVGGKRVADVVQAISDRRDSLDGGEDFDQGIELDGKPNLVPTDSNGLVFSRDVRQVLAILYNGGANSGGFFPEGLNARVKSQAQGRRMARA